MAIDLDALQAVLETDSRYDAPVTSGNHAEVLRLLNEEEPGQTKFLDVPIEDVLEAIGDGIQSLTAEALGRLRLFTNLPTVDFNRPAIRTEIRTIFAGNAPVLTRLQTLAVVPRTFGEGFGGQVGLPEIRTVLRLVSKSHLARYNAGLITPMNLTVDP